MAITSTVPGAVAALSGYMTAIKNAATPLSSGVTTADLGIYPNGLPAAAVKNNVIALGNHDTGSVVTPLSYKWAAVPASARLRFEEYALSGIVRTSGGTGGQIGAQERTNDAFTIINALHQQIVADPAGGGNLSSSGSWGDFDVTMHFSGPQGQSGWMVMFEFELHVINAQISG